MSSEQVRNRKIFCRTAIVPRSFLAVVKGPYSLTPFVCGVRVNSTRGKSSLVRDLQVGKRLVVFEFLIESRLNVLDQPGFQQQGIDFAVGLDVVEVMDFGDQIGRPPIFERLLREVARQPGCAG